MVRSTARFSCLVLVAPLGIKLRGRDERDIADMHGTERAEYLQLAWADPAKGEVDYTALPDTELAAIVRPSRHASTRCSIASTNASTLRGPRACMQRYRSASPMARANDEGSRSRTGVCSGEAGGGRGEEAPLAGARSSLRRSRAPPPETPG